MAWWQIVFVVVVFYLLAALGPWLLVQILRALVGPFASLLTEQEEALGRLRQVEAEHSDRWPEEPRPGRYGEIDRAALGALADLRQTLQRADELEPPDDHEIVIPMAVGAIALLTSWRSLFHLLPRLSLRRRLSALVKEGERAAQTLQQQAEAAESLPGQLKVMMVETKAELRRVAALVEGEEEQGTQGLQEVAQRLDGLISRLDSSVGSLHDEEQVTSQDTVAADRELRQAQEQLEEVSDLVDQVRQARERAEGVIERVDSGVSLAAERWAALTTQGANDAEVEQSVSELGEAADQVHEVMTARTMYAYRQTEEAGQAFDRQFQELSARLDALRETMLASKEAIEGDVRTLAQAQEMVESTMAEHDLLVPDQSKALIEEASEAYMEAERQRSSGNLEGYQTALALAEDAHEKLDRAMEDLETASGQVTRIDTLLVELAAERRQALRERASEAAQALSAYGVHWANGLRSQVETVSGRLQSVEAEFAQVPEEIGSGQAFRQSLLDSTLARLSHISQEMADAREIVGQLESELARLQEHRERLEEVVAQIAAEDLPALEAQREQMLPELAERLNAFLEQFREQAAALENVSEVDYDQRLNDWLPRVQEEIEEISQGHRRDLRHYQRAARRASKDIQRAWSRLEKLEPTRTPRADVDAESLAAEVASWQQEIETVMDSPHQISQLVTRRAALLERRLDTAREQLREGRKRLQSLQRDYERQRSAVERRRAALRELERDNQWRQVRWPIDEAEDLWQSALDLQQASAQAETILEASQALERATNLGEQAERVYRRLEQEMKTALERLDHQHASLLSALGKTRERADRLRAQGPSEELTRVDSACDAAVRMIGMAQSAGTFEDALRYLRQAKDALERA